MKYWILAFVALVLLVVGDILFSHSVSAPRKSININQPLVGQLAPSVTPQIDTPDGFTVAFYQWYLQGFNNDPRFSDSSVYKSEINNWLTPTFVANWDSIVVNTDNNPVLLAQDTANSWLTNINASITTQSATDATVTVSLGLSSELHKLMVVLVRINGAWHIASVNPAS